MLRNVVLILLAACIVLPVAISAKEILIVADEWAQMELLGKYFEDEGGFTVTKMEQGEIPDDLSKYDGVIEFVHGMLDDEPAAKMMKYALEGGRLMVLHHGVSSKKIDTKGWYGFLGMMLDRSKDAEHYYAWIKGEGVDITMVNLQPHHYITSNGVQYNETLIYTPSDHPSVPVEAPAITFKNTEIFLNHQFTDGREKTVLFGIYYKDSRTHQVYMQDRAGWYKRKGKGWLFYFLPGDQPTDMEHKNYCQILMNAFTWQPGD